ncbi:MAG: hypothetical protein ABI325_03160 [Ginsengibacter sp.]
MHPYVPYLLADIAAAERTEITEEIFPQTIEEHLEEVDRWLEGEEPPHTFGYYCGLEVVNFPPQEQLSLYEMEMVCEAFKQMMLTWSLGVKLPGNLPVTIVYPMMVDSLNSKTDIPNSEFMDFDLCSGYAPDCVLKEYCCCLEFWNNLEDDDRKAKSHSDDELPF